MHLYPCHDLSVELMTIHIRSSAVSCFSYRTYPYVVHTKMLTKLCYASPIHHLTEYNADIVTTRARKIKGTCIDDVVEHCSNKVEITEDREILFVYV